jgi:hypothetical protein
LLAVRLGYPDPPHGLPDYSRASALSYNKHAIRQARKLGSSPAAGFPAPSPRVVARSGVNYE